MGSEQEIELWHEHGFQAETVTPAQTPPWQGSPRSLAPERIALARSALNIEVIDRTSLSSNDVIQAFLEREPGGFDATVECAGFRFPTTLSHQIQRTGGGRGSGYV